MPTSRTPPTRRRSGPDTPTARTQRRPGPRLVAAAGLLALAFLTGVTVHRSSAPRPTGPVTSTLDLPGASGSPPTIPSELPGLQTTTAPWQPEYRGLPSRLAALRLPPVGDESYHAHAHLAVYVNGRPVPVPANIGLSEADRLEAPVHTHDATGVIHLEAARPSDAFTLGTVLTLWGVRFTASELGGYQTGGGSALKVYVNGTETPNGPAVQLREHDDIVLAFGVPGSSPTTSPYRWPEEK